MTEYNASPGEYIEDAAESAISLARRKKRQIIMIFNMRRTAVNQFDIPSIVVSRHFNREE